MKHTVLIALTFDNAAESGDLAEALYARLDECYPDTNGGFAVPQTRRVVATTPEVFDHLLSALEVGLSHDHHGPLDEKADYVRRLIALRDGTGVATVL